MIMLECEKASCCWLQPQDKCLQQLLKSPFSCEDFFLSSHGLEQTWRLAPRLEEEMLVIMEYMKHRNLETVLGRPGKGGLKILCPFKGFVPLLPEAENGSSPYILISLSLT